MLDDLTKTVKAQLYERVSSPLFGSFLISWVVWNYKFVLIILASATFVEKIEYIEKNLFPTLQHAFIYGIIFPLGSAIIFIYIYPIFAKYPYEYWQSKQAELKKIQQNIEDLTPLTQEEARELRTKLIQKDAEFDKLISTKDGEIKQLKQAILDLQSAPTPVGIAQFPPVPLVPEPALDQSQLSLLNELAEMSPQGLQTSVLLSQKGVDKTAVEFDIDELLKHQYASEYSEAGARKIRISQQGRARVMTERKRVSAAKSVA